MTLEVSLIPKKLILLKIAKSELQRQPKCELKEINSWFTDIHYHSSKAWRRSDLFVCGDAFFHQAVAPPGNYSIDAAV